jgi:hypothetical protein
MALREIVDLGVGVGMALREIVDLGVGLVV